MNTQCACNIIIIIVITIIIIIIIIILLLCHFISLTHIQWKTIKNKK